MPAYYNEIEPYAAQWLRNLIDAGHIAPGDVDERDIKDVLPTDLAGYTQCHFFAGIGGWSYALRLAGWPDDCPVWTGSCPCQPFSAAGKRMGFADERHLWPAWYWLIEKLRPPILFGEQTADGDGKQWLDLVSNDMENIDYAFGATHIPACSVGATMLKQRAWYVGRANASRCEGKNVFRQWSIGAPGPSAISALSGTNSEGLENGKRETGEQSPIGTVERCSGPAGGLEGSNSIRQHKGSASQSRQESGATLAGQSGGFGSMERSGCLPANGFWRNAEWLWFRDEKFRALEPGTFPLADGIPARVGKIRAYGNAIVPQVAAEVIRAFMGSNFR